MKKKNIYIKGQIREIKNMMNTYFSKNVLVPIHLCVHSKMERLAKKIGPPLPLTSESSRGVEYTS